MIDVETRPTAIPRAGNGLLMAVLALYSVAVVAPLLVPSAPRENRETQGWTEQVAENVVSVTYDDGFYYLRIAQHLAEGKGSTFDGIHPTNGYHPLWLLALVPLALVSPSPETLLLSSMLVQVILTALSVVLVFAVARRACGHFGSTVAALAWVRLLCTYWMPWSGMEYALHALILVGLLYAYLVALARKETSSPARFAALGTLASLAVLVRLDNVLLACFVGLAFGHRERRRGWDRRSTLRLASFGSPILVVSAVYLGANLLLFGHAFPVSGVIKREWSSVFLSQDPQYVLHGWWLAKETNVISHAQGLSRSFSFGLLVGGLAAALAALARPVSRRQNSLLHWMSRGALPFAAFSAVQLVAYLLLYHGGLSFQPWHFVVQPLLCAIWLGVAADVSWKWVRAQASGSAGRRVLTAAILSLWCLMPLFTLRAIGYRLDRQRAFLSSDPLYAAARWAQRGLSPEAIVGSWNAGMISFLSQKKVVNLDGLVNSWSYHLAEKHDLCRYWERNRLSYLVDVFDAERRFALLADQIRPCSDRIELIWSAPGYPGTTVRAEALRLPLREETAGERSSPAAR